MEARRCGLAYPFPPNIDHIKVGRNRYYPIPDDGNYISITAMLKAVVAKGDGITNWAASGERQLCLSTAAARSYWGETAEYRLAMLTAAVGKGLAWKRRIKDAADIGTAIHDCAARHLNLEMGVPCELPRPEGPVLLAYQSFASEWAGSGLIPVKMEQTVWHPGLRVAGRGDLFAIRQSDMSLGYVDYKSSTGIYDEMHLQATFYREAACVLGLPVEWAQIWRLPKKLGEPMKVEVADVGHLYCEKPCRGPCRCGRRVRSHDQLLDGVGACKVLWDTLCAEND